MKVKISKIFDYFPGNHGLTEEVIYSHQPTTQDDCVPIFSGSGDNEIPIGTVNKKAKNNKNVDVVYFESPCLILTKDGSAGLLTFKESGIFTINHHACVLKIKNEWKDKVNPEWFVYQYQKELYQYVTSKSDNQVFSMKWFEKLSFEIPPYDIQIRQLTKKRNLRSIITHLKKLDLSLKQILREYNLDSESIGTSSLKNVFHFYGGNNNLTEEFIYHNLPSNEEEKLPVFSGATIKGNTLGYVNRDAEPSGKRIKIFAGPAILVIRKGIAGRMLYIDEKEFTIKDDAYVLIPKKEWKDKINLRWFMYQYQGLFYNLVSSKSDNATFNKKYAEKQNIQIPNLSIQARVGEKLLKIDSLIEKIEYLKEGVEEVLRYEIVDPSQLTRSGDLSEQVNLFELQKSIHAIS